MADKTVEKCPNNINGENVDDTRRIFLRKATWTAPALITLGTLGVTNKAEAQIGPSPSLEPASMLEDPSEVPPE